MVIGRTELHSPDEVRKRFEDKKGYITMYNPNGKRNIVYFVSCNIADEGCKEMFDGNPNKIFDPYTLELCYFDTFECVDFDYIDASFVSMRRIRETFFELL